MGTRRVVNDVTSDARRATLEADQLILESVIIEQPGAATIDARHEAEIQVASRLVGYLVGQAGAPEGLARPLSTVAVAGDRPQPVALGERRELAHNRLW